MTNIYGALSAKDALDLFAKRRKDMAAKLAAGQPLTAEEKYEQDGGMTDLAQQNPAAWKLLKVGANYRVDPNNSGEHVRDTFNPSTGEWETQQTKGYWDHPESWMQLAFGAGMGAVGVAGLVGNSANAAVQGGLYGSEFLAPSVAGNAAAFGGAAAPAAASTLGTLATTGAINTGIGVAGNLAGNIIQTKANSKAADEAAAAARYAAELQDAAAKRTEQFLREQAQNQFANSEATRKGNYDQWRARENRFSTLSATLGAGARQIPDYVPGVDPRYLPGGTDTNTGVNGENTQKTNTNPGGTPTPGGTPNTSNTQVEPGGAQQGGGQTSSDPTMQALLDNYKALGRTPTGAGTGPTDIAYFAKRIAETGGLTEDNKKYWFGPDGRIAKELAGAVPQEGSAATQKLSSPGAAQMFDYNAPGRQPLTAALDPNAPRLAMPGTLATLAQQQKWFY